jgi:hypothetical protein
MVIDSVIIVSDSGNDVKNYITKFFRIAFKSDFIVHFIWHQQNTFSSLLF